MRNAISTGTGGASRKLSKKVSACALALLAFLVSVLAPGAPAWASDQSTFEVYFPLYVQSGIFVFPVKYTTQKTLTPARAALQALIDGPVCNEVLQPIIPPDTQILGISVKDGLCTVNLSREIRKMPVGAPGEAAVVSAIVATLTQFPTIDRVQILVEGSAESLAGHIDITGPLESDWSKRFVPFPDVVQHWSGGYVGALQAMDIAAGYEDGNFNPERLVTRAEFVKLAVMASGAKEAPGQAVPFTDVGGHWVLPYLKSALVSGIVDPGIYGARFVPDEVITREEMALILVRAHNLYVASSEQSASVNNNLTFSDSGAIQERFTSAVSEAVSRELLMGYPDGTFRPNSGLKRGEAAAAIARLMGIRGADQVVLLSPKSGIAWNGRTVQILGLAAAFEGTVNLEVVASDGTPILSDYVTSTNGMGWGAFGYVLSPHQLQGKTPAELRVYLTSPKDGSRYSVVNILVTD